MFFKVIGILWITLGIWWIMRPQSIKKRFNRIVKRTRRKVIFLTVILVTGIFFSAAKYAHGVLANVFLAVAILGVIKAIFFISSKAADGVVDWWLERPLWMWRAWAGILVIIGMIFQRIRQ